MLVCLSDSRGEVLCGLPVLGQGRGRDRPGEGHDCRSDSEELGGLVEDQVITLRAKQLQLNHNMIS